MKKILLATTILGMSAGYAAADITWGGSAAAGIARDGNVPAVAPGTAAEIAAANAAVNAARAAYIADPTTANQQVFQDAVADRDALLGSPAEASGPFQTYSSVNLAVTFSGTSDSGLTFGATFDMTAGRSYTLGDGDTFADEDGSFGMPTVFVEGSFGKLAISDDNYDFYDDTNAGGDIEYTGTFGAITTGLIVDVDSNNASAKVGYSAGALALNANMDTYELWNIDATYTMGSIAVTAATDESENSSLKLAFANNGISASAKYNTNGGDASLDPSIDVAAGYEANGLIVNVSVDDVSNANNTETHWTVTGSYDLGGGLSVEAGTNYTEDMMVGAKMAF